MRIIATIILIFIAICTRLSAEPIIRVGVLRVCKPDYVIVSCKSGLCPISSNIRSTSELRISGRGRQVQVEINHEACKKLSVIELVGSGGAPIRLRCPGVDSSFRGRLRFSSHSGTLLIVNEVGLEDYVRGVVANEMRHEWPAEALKAQAVIARTLAVQRLGEHKREGFDICDTTHCQVYRGVLSETSATNAAVRDTSGQILTYNNAPIQALYCSCCGGVSASSYASSALGNAPYLRVQKDSLNGSYACKESPHFNWNCSVYAPELAAAVRSDSRTNPGTRLTGLRALKYDTSGRIVYAEIQGERPKEVDGYILWNTLCRKLGWGGVKSTRCKISKSGSTYTFRGHGLGHGIGLCQWGAGARAKAGWDYRRILAFYYPGTKLTRNLKSLRNQPGL